MSSHAKPSLFKWTVLFAVGLFLADVFVRILIPPQDPDQPRTDSLTLLLAAFMAGGRLGLAHGFALIGIRFPVSPMVWGLVTALGAGCGEIAADFVIPRLNPFGLIPFDVMGYIVIPFVRLLTQGLLLAAPQVALLTFTRGRPVGLTWGACTLAAWFSAELVFCIAWQLTPGRFHQWATQNWSPGQFQLYNLAWGAIFSAVTFIGLKRVVPRPVEKPEESPGSLKD